MQNINTDRLTIREFVPEDAAFIFELLNTPTWIQFIGDRNIKTLADAHDYIVDKMMPNYVSQGFGFYAVALKESAIVIGMCGLIKRDGLDDIDIGFAFLPAYEGKGYAYESSLAILNLANHTLGIQRIAAITTKDNIHSIRLLEKLGLVFERHIYLPADPEELMLFGKDRL